MDSPGISFFGAAVVAGGLLRRSKTGQEGHESYAEKMARDNFPNRVNAVRYALNTRGGPTLAAARRIIGDGGGFFTDVPAEKLAEWLDEELMALKTGDINLPAEAFGPLDFTAAAMAIQPDDEDEDEADESEEADEEESDDEEEDDDESPDDEL